MARRTKLWAGWRQPCTGHAGAPTTGQAAEPCWKAGSGGSAQHACAAGGVRCDRRRARDPSAGAQPSWGAHRVLEVGVRGTAVDAQAQKVLVRLPLQRAAAEQLAVPRVNRQSRRQVQALGNCCTQHATQCPPTTGNVPGGEQAPHPRIHEGLPVRRQPATPGADVHGRRQLPWAGPGRAPLLLLLRRRLAQLTSLHATRRGSTKRWCQGGLALMREGPGGTEAF